MGPNNNLEVHPPIVCGLISNFFPHGFENPNIKKGFSQLPPNIKEFFEVLITFYLLIRKERF